MDDMKDMEYVRRHISITNRKVNDIFDKVGKGNVSSLIEKSVLYYIERGEEKYVTEDQVKLLMLEYLKDIPVYSGEISNKNYENERENIRKIVKDILGL